MQCFLNLFCILNGMYIFPDVIEKSHKLYDIGDGTFGTVSLYKLPTGEELVVKETKVRKDFIGYPKDFICELDSLIKFRHFPNIVNIKGFCFNINTEKGYIFLEKMDCDLKTWIDQTPFNSRVSFIETFVEQIFGTLSALNSMHFVHGDIKTNNILVKYENNRPVFKLADFGKCSLISNYKTSYDGINTYKSAYNYSIYGEEYWAICIVLTELILGGHVFKNTPDKELNSINFSIDKILSKRLKPGQINKIPQIYWDVVNPIFNKQDIPIYTTYLKLGWDITHYVEYIRECRNKFKTFDNLENAECNRAISFFINEITTKYKRSKSRIDDKILKYKKLMNAFYSQHVDILDSRHIQIFAEIGYLCLISRRNYICKFLQGGHFLTYQRIFLTSLRYQIIYT